MNPSITCSIWGPTATILAVIALGTIIFMYDKLLRLRDDYISLEYEKDKLEKNLRHSHREIDELRDLTIYYYVLPYCEGKNPEATASLCVQHKDYVGTISKPEELFKYKPQYIIKVAKAAEQGLLDHFYDDNFGDYRLDKNGERIYLTNEQVHMMIDKDYSFFL